MYQRTYLWPSLPPRLLSISRNRCPNCLAARPYRSYAVSTHALNLRKIAFRRWIIAPKSIWCIGSRMSIWCTQSAEFSRKHWRQNEPRLIQRGGYGLPSCSETVCGLASGRTCFMCWTYSSRYEMERQLIYTRPETPDSCMVRTATFGSK